MHLFFFVRGKFEQVELWKAHAQTAYWKWRRVKEKTGKKDTILIQGALRPSVFGAYEYVFPKEALVEVCSFFGILPDKIGVRYNFKNKLKLNVLSKVFGCKKIPKDILKKAAEISPTFSTEEFERGGSNCIIPGVSLLVLGIKKDNYRLFKENGYLQEEL